MELMHQGKEMDGLEVPDSQPDIEELNKKLGQINKAAAAAKEPPKKPSRLAGWNPLTYLGYGSGAEEKVPQAKSTELPQLKDAPEKEDVEDKAQDGL